MPLKGLDFGVLFNRFLLILVGVFISFRYFDSFKIAVILRIWDSLSSSNFLVLNFLATCMIAELFDILDSVSLNGEVPSALVSIGGETGDVLFGPMDDLCEFVGDTGMEIDALVVRILVLKLKYFELIMLVDLDLDGF